DHSARDLSKRLVGTLHDNHQLVLSTLHVHLDHDHCMEATVLKGKSAQVQAVANQIIAERGVRHGRLIMIPAELEAETHDHGGEGSHSHIKIKYAAARPDLPSSRRIGRAVRSPLNQDNDQVSVVLGAFDAVPGLVDEIGNI